MSGNIEDPFLKTFFARIPKDVAPTFTAPQLDAVKRAFGARYRGAHTIDLRLSVPLWRRSIYLVFLAGAEQRVFDRRPVKQLFRQLWTFTNAIMLMVDIRGRLVHGRLRRQAAGRLGCYPWSHVARPDDRAASPLTPAHHEM
jgi:hypothetical protein